MAKIIFSNEQVEAIKDILSDDLPLASRIRQKVNGTAEFIIEIETPQGIMVERVLARTINDKEFYEFKKEQESGCKCPDCGGELDRNFIFMFEGKGFDFEDMVQTMHESIMFVNAFMTILSKAVAPSFSSQGFSAN